MTWTAYKVLDKLQKGPFKAGAHTMLREVRNATGYARRERYADAVVVSTWPSRGLWLAGVEVKVARSDWRKELEQPEKSAPIQKYCDFWWVAAPAGVVELGEVPETWGYVEVGRSCKTVVKAPRLKPEPLGLAFLASILRKVEESQGAIAAVARREAREELQEELSNARKERHEATNQGSENTILKADVEQLKKTLEAYEKATGIQPHELGRYGDPARAKRQYDLAQVLAGRCSTELQAQLTAMGSALENAKQQLAAAAKADLERMTS